MRESSFIKKNLPRWQKIQEEPTEDPDETAERFTALLDDLAYAKTFYSHSKVTAYINNMAAGIFQRIYRDHKGERGRIRNFVSYELPLLICKNHRLFLFTFCYFLLICIIGAFSAANDETFVRGVLGDAYVNMTEDNIERGDPFNVYKDSSEWAMWLRIADNNIRVAMFCFVAGIALSAGTLFILFRNGIMLGSFQYFFFAKGLGWPSVLVIWIHGTLEISSIIIAGTAGMIMGNSLIFPGTLTRRESLKRGAMEGLKIIVALVPIFILAAWLESFVTRHTAMPMAVSIGILAVSAVFIAWYFVFYPIRVERRGYRLNDNGKVIKPVAA
ncbi:stage II sporulation protein M [Chitinophaga lutea]